MRLPSQFQLPLLRQVIADGCSSSTSAEDWYCTSPSGNCAYTASSCTYLYGPDYVCENGACVEGTPDLSVSPLSLNFECDFGIFNPNPDPKTLSIRNSGEGTLEWTITNNKLWISTNPLSGTSGTGNRDVTVSVLKGLMLRGTYTGTITVTSNGGTTNIPVWFTIN